MNVLVLNAGSSSLRFQIIATDLDRIQQDKHETHLQGRGRTRRERSDHRLQAKDNPKQKFTATLLDISAALDYLV